jgi:hypothetical protein
METFNSLSPVIQNHMKQMAKASGLPTDDETLERLAEAWVEKMSAFNDGITDNSLETVEFFSKDEARGAVALTYSGSLLNIGPLVDGKRRVEYASIGFRTNVPASAVEENSVLAGDAETDEIITFTKGPIQQSSPIYKIAVSTLKLDAAAEEELLTCVTQDIAEEFVEVNKTIVQQ